MEVKTGVAILCEYDYIKRPRVAQAEKAVKVGRNTLRVRLYQKLGKEDYALKELLLSQYSASTIISKV